tara:strand:+ start:511 stop:906 length:396 start_codon:yes stop_codon:yes gene_type:complete
MNEEHAVWNIKYMPDFFGRPQKICKMSIKQVDERIRFTKVKMKTNKSWLDGLYQRRAVLLLKAGDINYQRKNTNEKIIQTLQLRKDLKTDEAKETYDSKLKAILLTCLDFLEKGKSPELVKAILEQARDEL